MSAARRASLFNGRTDAVALGCSALIHGVAIAAFVVLQASPPQQPPAPPAITIALQWSSAATDSSDATAAWADAWESPAEAGAALTEAPASPPANHGSLSTEASAAPTVEAPAVPPANTTAASTEAAPSTLTETVNGKDAVRELSAASFERRVPEPPPAKPVVVPRYPPREMPAAAAPAATETGERPSTSPPGAAMADSTASTARSEASAEAMPGAAAPSAWSVASRVAPVYPMAARRRGIEGDVSLRVDVGADGRARVVAVQRGSGDSQLDAAAARAVEQWRFAVATPMTIEIPIAFRLNTDAAEVTQR